MSRSTGRRRPPTAVWLVPLAAACAPVATPAAPPPMPESAEPVTPDTSRTLLPVGYGSLHQDEFSVQLEDAALRLKVTPLTEQVTRLAAPDTYDRLQALARSRISEAGSMTDGRESELFLVSFFSRDPNVAYQPDDLVLTHRGRTVRPAGIIPLTTGWGRQLLQPQQTQSAIYVFEGPFDYELPLTVRYGLRQSEDWHRQVLPRLEEERARVVSRAGGA